MCSRGLHILVQLDEGTDYAILRYYKNKVWMVIIFTCSHTQTHVSHIDCSWYKYFMWLCTNMDNGNSAWNLHRSECHMFTNNVIYSTVISTVKIPQCILHTHYTKPYQGGHTGLIFKGQMSRKHRSKSLTRSVVKNVPMFSHI